jgi:hypothetical protein
MHFGRKFLKIYFLLFGVLSIIAVIPEGTLVAFLIGAIVPFDAPGYLVLASPTILLYSAALVPLWLAVTATRRRIWLIAAAALVPLDIAIGPGLQSQRDATQFVSRISKDDMSSPVAGQPRSIELVGDMASGLFPLQQNSGDLYATCNEICRRLLFNGEAEWVRVTQIPDVYRNRRADRIRSVSYHREHRDSCPDLYPAVEKIEKTARDRLIAGDCLIAETSDVGDVPDATLTFTTPYSSEREPAKPLDQGPQFARVTRMSGLHIESRKDGAARTVLHRTETVVKTTALPFYIGAEMSINGGYNGPTIGRRRNDFNQIDVSQALRDTFGYRLAAITAPPSEDAGKIAERILALSPDASPAFSAPQQDALLVVLAPMPRQLTLSDSDVDFVRRVIADRRVNEVHIGIELRKMFRQYTDRLEPLIPVVLDRISIPVSQEVGNYHRWLGGSLENYSAKNLRPYREKMIAVVEAQPDGPSDGVLARLAELGSDEAVNLVIQRLDSKLLRRSAAIAACRARAEAWPALEPAVLAHLTSPLRGHGLGDDERALMLALIRFGNKALVSDTLEKRDLIDKKRVIDELAKFEPGFAPEHCRD